MLTEREIYQQILALYKEIRGICNENIDRELQVQQIITRIELKGLGQMHVDIFTGILRQLVQQEFLTLHQITYAVHVNKELPENFDCAVRQDKDGNIKIGIDALPPGVTQEQYDEMLNKAKEARNNHNKPNILS